MNKSWIEIKAFPAGIHVHQDSNGPHHPLTPEAIRKKRGSAVQLDAVAWRQETLCGVIIGITERTWQTKDVTSFILCYSRPAKGAGSVSITIEANDISWPNQFITSSKNFSEELLVWSRSLMNALNNLGFNTQEKDEGHDA
jgi:hypothetical protein